MKICITFLVLFVSVISGFSQDPPKSIAPQEKKIKDVYGTAKNIHKQAHELPYFQLPWLGKNYDRWSPSKVERTPLTAEQINALPSRVDNSTNKAWQGIGNQKEKNCCSQEGTIAGMFSYEICAIRNLDASKPENKLPTHFSWNFFNKGINYGAEMIHGLETAYTIGIPSQKAYGGRYQDKVGVWPNGYSIWHDAMKNRAAGYDFMKVDTPDRLNLARAWIYNHAGWFKSSGGGMFAIDGTDVWDAAEKKIPKGQHEAGKHIWTDWGNEYGGHVMCVVGYDDKVGYDVNGDGKITNDIDIDNDGKVTLADFERGAFIVANSWGKKWADEGKIYVLYRCLMSRKEFWDRGPFLGYAVPSAVQPRLTLRLKAQHNKRDKLSLNISIIDKDKKRYSWNPGGVLFDRSGSFPLGGPETEGKDLEFGLDLTSLAESASSGNLEGLLKDLREGRASVEVLFKEKRSRKKTDNKGVVKEAELKFWDEKDKQIDSKNLLSSEKALKSYLKI